MGGEGTRSGGVGEPLESQPGHPKVLVWIVRVWPESQSMTPLIRALQRGLAPGGDLTEELWDLGDYQVTRREDAEAICSALAQLSDQPVAKGANSPLRALARLFQDVPDAECPAFDILHERGLAELCRVFEARCDEADEEEADDLLLVLKVASMYGTEEAVGMIRQAAGRPLLPGGYMWSMVLGVFKPGHPHMERLFDAFREELPPGFIGIALLDAANAACLGEISVRHPFDSPEGLRRLEGYLRSTKEEESSYAHSAAAALPFLEDSRRDRLLRLALDHPSPRVRLEGAWAAARLAQPAGWERLAQACLDVRQALVAARYLEELGRRDLIPLAAHDPAFQARADFAEWLAHPNELGRLPDVVEIVDHRKLPWPPDGIRKPFYLVRYRAADPRGLEADDVDSGVVGSVTFCLFSYRMAQRPPEDAYAIHCYWEMEQAGHITEECASDSPGEYDALLAHWPGPPLEAAQLITVAELSPALSYPSRLVALARARAGGRLGWVVVDGPRSRWYPRDDMPAGAHEQTVLMLHVGRVLLRFAGEPDRRRWLASSAAPPAGEALAAAYEALLARTPAEDSDREGEWDFPSVAGNHLVEYAQALAALGRPSRLIPVLDRFEQRWEGGEAWLALGQAAWSCGLPGRAQRWLQRWSKTDGEAHRHEAAAQLLEALVLTGQPVEAREWLWACLHKLAEERLSADPFEADAARRQYGCLWSRGLHLLADLEESQLIAQQLPRP